MSEARLDWNSADVREATLSVPLEGDVDKGWKASFETTVRLLGGGDWGEVELHKRKVSVAGVEPGSEDKLKHFLESAVAQANADARPEEEEEDTEGEDGEDEAGGPDAEMTSRFRSFGEGEGEGEAKDEDED